MKNNNRWSQLSMQQRADFFKKAIELGITDRKAIIDTYNKYSDGGNILSGEEEGESTLSGKKPTLEEYIQHKIDSVRNAAHELSLSRNKGIEIKYPLTEERRLYNEHIIDEYLYDVNRSYSPPRSDEQAEIRTLNVEDKRRVANYQQAVKELENNCEYGLNCIGSALDNYPEDSRENVNSTFAKNFEQLGFKEIDLSEARPGDIVQAVDEEGPFHGMIFSRLDETGRPLYNYSSGGIEEGHYVKEGNFYVPINYAYTYVGTPTLIQQWTEEYNNTKAFGGRILDGTSEENQTLSNTDVVEPSVIVDYSKAIAEGENAAKFVKDYYRSEAYKQRAKNAGFPRRYPLKKSFGVFDYKTRYDENITTDQSRQWLFPVVGLQPSENPFYNNYYDDVGHVTAHENAHLNRFYNRKANSKSPDSLYYGNDYSKVKKFKDALNVNVDANIHDLELSESYSDLIGLRYLMQKHDIFDSMDPNAIFTEEDYNSLINDSRYENDRFLKLHSKEQVIEAINDVASNYNINLNSNVVKNGGKLNKFDEGGTAEKYPIDAATSNGEKYADIITQREQDAYNALLRRGYSIEDARRLSPILTSQSIYETGWRLKDSNNNYAGYLDSKGKKLKYNSVEEFWDSHLKNLSERWSNWDTAQNVEEYYNIVNQTHLNLKSKEEYNKYKRQNPNTFIYSPTWENTNYKTRLMSTSDRVQSYLNRLSMNKDFPLNPQTSTIVENNEFSDAFLFK